MPGASEAILSGFFMGGCMAQKDPEQRRAYYREYTQANKEKRKLYFKAYYEKHKATKKAYNKAYRDSHKIERKVHKVSVICRQCGIFKTPDNTYKRSGSVTQLRSICKQCMKDYEKDNHEHTKNYQQIYQKQHKEEFSIYKKEWYKNNQRKRLAQEKERRKGREEEFNLKQRIRYKNNPEPYLEYARNRRAVRQNAFIATIRTAEIGQRDNWKCQICKSKINKNLKYPHPLSKSIDHIIPLDEGGTHEPKNAQIAHLVCNLKKHTKAQFDQLRIF